MREAVIVSTARTPIGKAYRGAFNDLESPSMAAPVIKEAIRRARIDPAEIDDVIMGAALQQGTQSFNIGRQSAMAAELPVTVSGQSVDRQCSSGLMSISMGPSRSSRTGCRRWSRAALSRSAWCKMRTWTPTGPGIRSYSSAPLRFTWP